MWLCSVAELPEASETLLVILSGYRSMSAEASPQRKHAASPHAVNPALGGGGLTLAASDVCGMDFPEVTRAPRILNSGLFVLPMLCARPAGHIVSATTPAYGGVCSTRGSAAET